MTTKQIVESAIKGGWRNDKEWEIKQGADDYYVLEKKEISTEMIYFSRMLLDPKFWQAVGKVEGWDNIEIGDRQTPTFCHPFKFARKHNWIVREWEYKMHSMIDCLAEGKSIKEFLKTL